MTHQLVSTPIPVGDIIFKVGGGKEVLRFCGGTGEMKIADGTTPTQAAKDFVEIVTQLWPHLVTPPKEMAQVVKLCDCGGRKANTTCSTWCSSKKK